MTIKVIDCYNESIMSKEKKVVISCKNVNKKFKLYYDKANTLKEKIMFFKKRNKNDVLHILKDVNLDIYEGETVGLIGVNGSGKSTLLKMIAKILYPTSGNIEVNGKIASLIELGAGFHPDFSGRENIYFNSSIFGLTRSQIDARVEDIIDFSEIRDFIDNPIRTYSSGMYMRLAFAIAVHVEADILLIDEILSVGDQHFQQKCFAKMNELKEQGKTIVLVTHSMGQVKDFATRAVWLKDGRVEMDGDPNTVVDEYLKQFN